MSSNQRVSWRSPTPRPAGTIHGSVAPGLLNIQVLPNEVLVHIFSYVLLWKDRRLGSPTIASLSLVCYQWRQVLIHEPHFWTYVSLGGWKGISLRTIDVLLLQIERCGTEALVDLDFSQLTTRSDAQKNLPDLLRQEAHRVRSFKWWGYNASNGRSFGHEVMESEYVQMVSLDVSFEAITGRFTWYTLFYQLPGPNLQTVKIRGMHLKDWKGCEASNLTYLHLDDCLFRSTAITDLLRSCPRLKTLLINGRVTDGATGVNTTLHHNAQDFDPTPIQIGRVTSGAKLLEFPCLKTLDLDGNDLLALQTSWRFNNLHSLCMRGVLDPDGLQRVSSELCQSNQVGTGDSKLGRVLSRLTTPIIFQFIMGSFCIYDEPHATLRLTLTIGHASASMPHHIMDMIEESGQRVCLRLNYPFEMENFPHLRCVSSIEVLPSMLPKAVLETVRFLGRASKLWPYPSLRQLLLPRSSDVTTSSLRKALKDLKKRGSGTGTTTFHASMMPLTVYAEGVEVLI